MTESINQKKRKKPNFRSPGANHKKIKKRGWRNPRGIDSKQRKGKRETPKRPNIGYRQPKKIRGLHPSGYTDNLVHNTNELEKLDKEKDAVRIASTVSKKKRETIIEKAKKQELKILNE